jgi:hypothetical protein
MPSNVHRIQGILHPEKFFDAVSLFDLNREAPDSLSARRKVGDFPHIGRRSRKIAKPQDREAARSAEPQDQWAVSGG